jgi:hypothetical protein
VSGKPQFPEDSAVVAFAQVIPTLPVRILKSPLCGNACTKARKKQNKKKKYKVFCVVPLQKQEQKQKKNNQSPLYSVFTKASIQGH